MSPFSFVRVPTSWAASGSRSGPGGVGQCRLPPSFYRVRAFLAANSLSPQTGLLRAGWCLPSGVGGADPQAGAALGTLVEGRAPTVVSCLSVRLPIHVSMGARAKVGKWVITGCADAGETQACDKVRETVLGLMLVGRWIRRGSGMAPRSPSSCTPLLQALLGDQCIMGCEGSFVSLDCQARIGVSPFLFYPDLECCCCCCFFLVCAGWLVGS